MKGHQCICLLLCLFQLQGQAQINNDMLYQEIDMKDSIENTVLFSVQSRNVFKNNEYFHDITSGYTLMGTQWYSSLAYQLNSHLRIQGGIFLQQDFGHDGLKKIQPLFTVKYAANGYTVLFGALEGNVSHRVIDPLLNYERYILQPLENGVQIKADKKMMWMDNWMNWEKMQYLGDSIQEQFTIGHSSKWHVVQKPKIKIDIPIQLMVTHRGGQIDIDTTALQTVINAAVGVNVSIPTKGFITSVFSENYVCLFKDFSPSSRLPYQDGNGYFINVGARTRYDISASLGYWNAHQFYASRGGELFQSVSSQYAPAPYLSPNRSLFFVRLMYQHKLLNHLYTDIRFEPYYDLGHSYFEYSYGCYLTYKNDFGIINLTKRKGTF